MSTDTVRNISTGDLDLQASTQKLQIKEQSLRAIACLFIVGALLLTAFTYKNVKLNAEITELQEAMQALPVPTSKEERQQFLKKVEATQAEIDQKMEAMHILDFSF